MNALERPRTVKASAAGSGPIGRGDPTATFSERSPKTAWSRRLLAAALLGFAFFSPWSISGAQVCLGLGLVAWLTGLRGRPSRPMVRSALFWPVMVYLAVQFLSVAFSSAPLTGLRAVRAEWIVLLFFLVINGIDDRRQVRRLIGVLVLTTVLVSLYAIWQHWSGWDLYRQRPLRAAGNFFEATGLFGHHLTFGGYLMMVLLLSGCLFLFGTRGRERLFYGSSSLVIFLALLFSYARSAWIGLLAGALGIAALRGRRTLAAALAGVAVIVALAAVLLAPVREQAGEAFAQLFDPAVTSDRLQLWSAARQLIGDHLLLGAGAGQAAGLLPGYGCDLGYGHLHNDLINTAANSGLLGLAAFLWIWITFLRLTARCRRSLQETPRAAAMAAAGFGIVIALLAAGQFQCYYTDAEDGMLLWFLMGLVTVSCGWAAGPAGRPASGTVVPARTAAE
jgi:putative inorganic carbon (HCO3(-)) transporter